jgi:hypothetical protein
MRYLTIIRAVALGVVWYLLKTNFNGNFVAVNIILGVVLGLETVLNSINFKLKSVLNGVLFILSVAIGLVFAITNYTIAILLLYYSINGFIYASNYITGFKTKYDIASSKIGIVSTFFIKFVCKVNARCSKCQIFIQILIYLSY